MLPYDSLVVTVPEADSYALARAWADWIGDATAKEAALRRGQDYIAGQYNGRWATVWGADDVPVAVRYAVIEAARRELATPGSLNPDYDPSGMIKREKSKVGPIEEEFEYAVPQSSFDARPVIGIIGSLLSGLLGSTGSAMNFRITRA